MGLYNPLLGTLPQQDTSLNKNDYTQQVVYDADSPEGKNRWHLLVKQADSAIIANNYREFGVQVDNSAPMNTLNIGKKFYITEMYVMGLRNPSSNSNYIYVYFDTQGVGYARNQNVSPGEKTDLISFFFGTVLSNNATITLDSTWADVTGNFVFYLKGFIID